MICSVELLCCADHRINYREKAQMQEQHTRDSAALSSKVEKLTCENAQLKHHNSTLVCDVTELKKAKMITDEQLLSLKQECHRLQEAVEVAQTCVLTNMQTCYTSSQLQPLRRL